MNQAPLTVLIVEDDPHVLLGCQQALALEDIACEGVGSAEQALERIGDDFAGTNCGFDSADGWRIVEIDPTNFSKDVVGEDFAAFIRIRIAAAS